MGLQEEMRIRIWLAAIIFHSPVRLRPVIGVMTDAHYRTLLMFFTSPHKLKFAGTPQIRKNYVSKQEEMHYLKSRGFEIVRLV